MKTTDFAEATGYLRAVEKKILTGAGFERIIDAPSCDEALKMLSQNSELDFSSLERAEDYEIVLNSELKRVYDMLYNLSPKKELVDILAAKYDFHNIKVAIKAFFLNEDYERLFIKVTELDTKEILDLVAGGDEKSLPPYICETVRLAKENFEETKDPQLVDILLDKLMFYHMYGLCEQLENEFITEYVLTQIDFFNLKLMLRVKNMQKGIKFLDYAIAEGFGTVDKDLYLDSYEKPVENIADGFSYKYFGQIMQETVENYEKTGTFSAIEKLADNFVINAIKQAKLVAFGPEPVFAYIIAKENEIKQIRMLITCKANNISMDTLKERLRDNYA